MVTNPAQSIQRLIVAFALVATATLTVAGCASPTAPTQSDGGSSVEAPAEESGTDSGSGAGAAMPADFPQDILIPDGELASGDGSGGSWVIVKEIQLVDQASVAADANVKSYGFTIDEFVDDGENSSWSLSNDRYDLLMELRPGSPITMTVTVDVR